MAQSDGDLLLLQRFSETGDPEAFAEIVRRYTGLVFAAGRRVLGDRSLAEEVAQETFYRLMTRPRAVTQSLGGWLHRSATRLALDERRSDAARRRRETAASEMQVEVQEKDDPDEPRWADIEPHLDAALAALPEESRDLLVRHYLRGQQQAELASELQTSAATLSRRMKQAVNLLRRELCRRGVEVLPSALCGLILRHGAEPVPISLGHALAKITLVSSVRASGNGAMQSLTDRCASLLRKAMEARWPVPTAAGLCALALAMLMVYVYRPDQPSPIPRDLMAGGRSNPAIRECPLITIGGPSDLNSERIVMFQQAAHAETFNLVFADGHTVNISEPQARALIEKQTGKTLEQLIRDFNAQTKQTP